jgi:hypothetical protein
MAAFTPENLIRNCVRVKQPFSLRFFDCGNKAFAVVHAAGTPAEGKFITIAVQVFFAHAMECPHDSAFQKAEKRFTPAQNHAQRHVLLAAVATTALAM